VVFPFATRHMLELYHKLGHSCFLPNLFQFSIHSPRETVLGILIFTFLNIRLDAKDTELHGSKHSLNLMYFLFLCECSFHYLVSFSNI